MEFLILTILAVISGIYCVISNNSVISGITQSIIAAYIFYLVQIVFMNKARLRKCRDAAYTEISRIENRMNDVIVLLSQKDLYENLSNYSEGKVRNYLNSTDIFHTGSRQDKNMKEMTIFEAIINDFEIIDEHINNLLMYNLVDEKTKKLLQDILHASIKETVKSLKENEPGNIENVKYNNDSIIKASASIRIINFGDYIDDIVSQLNSYDELLSNLKKEHMYPGWIVSLRFRNKQRNKN